MDLSNWLIILAAILVILFIVHLIFKTLKIIIIIGIVLLVIPLIYDYYQPIGENYEELGIYDCQFGSECKYIVNASNCDLVAGKCNNMAKFNENTQECNREAVIFNENITCNCVIEGDLSYCEAV